MRIVLLLVVFSVAVVLSDTLPTGGFPCKTDDDCNAPHGLCLQGNLTCICRPGWTNESCTYKMLSQTKAVVLSAVIGGVGADRFYMGLWTGASFKLILFISIFVVPIFVVCSFRADRDVLGRFLVFVTCCLILASIIFWMIDLILISVNKLRDRHGVLLYDDI